jgi:hypothetical protein
MNGILTLHLSDIDGLKYIIIYNYIYIICFKNWVLIWDNRIIVG